MESGSISTSDCFYFKFFCVSIFLVFLLGACGAAQPGQCMGRLMSLIIAHEQEQAMILVLVYTAAVLLMSNGMVLNPRWNGFSWLGVTH